MENFFFGDVWKLDCDQSPAIKPIASHSRSVAIAYFRQYLAVNIHELNAGDLIQALVVLSPAKGLRRKIKQELYPAFAERLRSEERTSELQSRQDIVCRLL